MKIAGWSPDEVATGAGLPHRLAGSLQFISLMAEHRLRSMEGKNIRHHLEWLTEMASTLHLLQQRASRSARKGTTLQAFLRDTAEYWDRVLGDRGIHVTVDVADHLRINDATMISLALLVHEELLRSIEHGFRDGQPGILAIRLVPLGHGRAELSISCEGWQALAGAAPAQDTALVQQLAQAAGWDCEVSAGMHGQGRRLRIRFHLGGLPGSASPTRFSSRKARRSPKVGLVAHRAMQLGGVRRGPTQSQPGPKLGHPGMGSSAH